MSSPTSLARHSKVWWDSLTEEQRQALAEQLVSRMLAGLGDDPTREGLADTPKRVVKSWKELFAGYKQDPKEVLGTTFAQEGYNYDQIILSKNIEIYSTCEHHLLPFYGVVHIAYIPSERVVGLSKLARLAYMYARRLQIQEKLTNQIAQAMEDVLAPKGVAVIIDCKHFCQICRGIRVQGSSMVTSAMRGVFLENGTARAELMSLIKS